MIPLWHKETGQVSYAHPVDAREMLALGTFAQSPPHLAAHPAGSYLIEGVSGAGVAAIEQLGFVSGDSLAERSWEELSVAFEPAGLTTADREALQRWHGAARPRYMELAARLKEFAPGPPVADLATGRVPDAPARRGRKPKEQ